MITIRENMLKISVFLSIFCCGIVAAVDAGVVICEADPDCIAEGATCVENVCECPKGQTLSYDGTRCLNYAVTYNAQCIEDVQCGLLLGKHACVDSRCRCQNGYKYFWGRCVKRGEIGLECAGNEECFNGIDYFASHCNSDGLCECNEGYYARGKFDCRPISTADGEICAIDSDCQYKDAYCKYGLCATKEDGETAGLRRAFLDDPITIPLNPLFYKELNEKCQNNEDCTVANSHCHLLFKICVCDRGNYESDGNCVAELGVDSNCMLDFDCKMANSKCVKGVCTCKQTHVYGDGNQLCKKSTTSPDYPCAFDESCALFGENYYCDFDEELFVKKCVCTMGAQFDAEHALCMGNALECNSDYICKTTKPNSLCENFKCVCKENFIESEGVCAPLIDGTCENTEECFIENTECDPESLVCKCSKGFVTLESDKCIPISTGLKATCDIDLQCTASVSNSLCKNKICACSDSYVEHESMCVRDNIYESYCESNEACRNPITSDFTCKSSKCQCPSDMKVRADKRGCVRDGTGSGNGIHPGQLLWMLLPALYQFI